MVLVYGMIVKLFTSSNARDAFEPGHVILEGLSVSSRGLWGASTTIAIVTTQPPCT